MDLFQVVTFLFLNYILIVSSASIPTRCKIPTDLKVRYENLSNATIGNHFFLPAEMAPAESNRTTWTVGDKSCPTPPVSSDIIRERSTCPWYLNITHDSTVFPPSRSEAVCRCRKCLESKSTTQQCSTVYTKMTVLKRTGKCVDGLYVYEPHVIDVATACVCARTVDVNADRNEDDYKT
ncbi:interleukin 17-like protein [Octopus bimaculoides]|uniref:Interleukin 17-like protein n=1 Tax=Octopus bimaculoides TaxID=37653 RepID=A0A0L8FUD5_OCTBM|nr:interleukin 17-like protein [Octopus bimaculoides]|eukprot:XP_014786843.1 PREDICTED: interleukin 17-like protein [Octopus bimaculoides]